MPVRTISTLLNRETFYLPLLGFGEKFYGCLEMQKRPPLDRQIGRQPFEATGQWLSQLKERLQVHRCSL